MLRPISLISLIIAIVMLWVSIHYGWETDTGTTCLGWAIGAWMAWVTIEIFSIADLLVKTCVMIQGIVEHPEAVEGFRKAIEDHRKETTEK